MATNHVVSQRANGARSASPSAPYGVVIPAGSNPVWRGSSPRTPAARAPATSTTTRDARSARHATAQDSPQGVLPSGRTPTMVADQRHDPARRVLLPGPRGRPHGAARARHLGGAHPPRRPRHQAPGAPDARAAGDRARPGHGHAP